MATDSNNSGIKAPPPLVVLACLAVAWGLEIVIPTTTGLQPIIRFPLGWALILGAILFVVWLFRGFSRIGEEYDYKKVPTKLVTDGAFAWSRNPGYAAMVGSCAGFALAFDNLWALAAGVIAYFALDILVIRKEEAILERQFGDAYRAYRTRVRRWI